MYRSVDLERIHHKLQETARKAVTDPATLRQVVDAMSAFDSWRNAPTDEPPVVVAQVLGFNWEDLAVTSADATVAMDDQAIVARIDEIRDLINEHNFAEASVRLELLARAYTSPSQRSVDQISNELTHSLGMEPSHGTSQDEFAKLDSQTVDEGFRQELAELRMNLGEIGRDITQVEAARLRVEQIRNDGSLNDIELLQDSEEIYELLDEQRNKILRASEGATSAERTGDYQQAIDKYRQAIMQGLAVIVDDSTGCPIEVAVALRRARKAYLKDVLRRVEKRYNEAKLSLAEGVPELATDRLEEAQILLKNVEEGADTARAKVDELLDSARLNLRQKEEAYKLVLQADQANDPNESRLLLLRAQQLYPGYPRIGAWLESKRKLVMRKVLNDMRADLVRAEGLLNQREFVAARKMCRQIMEYGQNLDIQDSGYEAEIERIQELLHEIVVAESRWHELRQTLNAVQKAIQDGNVPLAQHLLDSLNSAISTLPEVAELRVQVSLLGDNDNMWREAQRAFALNQNYAEVILLCEKLKSSPILRDEAWELQLRAQVRFWLEEALHAQERKQQDLCIGLYKKIIALQSQLPAVDQEIVRIAQTNLAQVRAM